MYQIEGLHGGNGAKVILDRDDLGLRVRITYLLYPGLPLVRKQLDFTNTGIHTRKLESLDTELLTFDRSMTYSWVMNDFARQKSLGQFEGNWYDPVVVVHQFDAARGIILGNEARE